VPVASLQIIHPHPSLLPNGEKEYNSPLLGERVRVRGASGTFTNNSPSSQPSPKWGEGVEIAIKSRMTTFGFNYI